jgi:hypothetical protein
VRRITRLFLAGIVVVALGLLALGALPGYLGSGDPYYLQATPTDDAGPAVNGTTLSPRQYPYLAEAVDSPTNRSSGYRAGGEFKEAFTHSPFDEVDALLTRQPNASVDGGDAVRVTVGNRTYLVSVVRGSPDGNGTSAANAANGSPGAGGDARAVDRRATRR